MEQSVEVQKRFYSEEQKARNKIRRLERKVEILEDEETLHLEHKSAYSTLTNEQKVAQNERKKIHSSEKLKTKQKSFEDKFDNAEEMINSSSSFVMLSPEQIEDYQKRKEEAIENFTEQEREKIRHVCIYSC